MFGALAWYKHWLRSVFPKRGFAKWNWSSETNSIRIRIIIIIIIIIITFILNNISFRLKWLIISNISELLKQ